MIDANVHRDNKRAVFEGMRQVCAGENANVYANDAKCHAYHPVNDLDGRDNIVSGLWDPLRTALPDIERRDSIVIAGEFDGQQIVACQGHLQGTFSKPLHDIPPTHGVVTIRYGEVHYLDNGVINRSWVLADMLDLMWQADCWPIAPSMGTEGAWPGPRSCDGVQLDHADPETGAQTIKLVKRMHEGLMKFDGKDIESMDHQDYWTKDFLWYGPSGIGTTRGLSGFRLHHQMPFLRAFPDRKVAEHFGEIGDGNYAVTGGWPSVVASHSGSGWLALPPTGVSLKMRVMDFYRTENGLINENWVPIDIIDILRQMGVDVFERMRHLTGRPRTKL